MTYKYVSVLASNGDMGWESCEVSLKQALWACGTDAVFTNQHVHKIYTFNILLALKSHSWLNWMNASIRWMNCGLDKKVFPKPKGVGGRIKIPSPGYLYKIISCRRLAKAITDNFLLVLKRFKSEISSINCQILGDHNFTH